MTASDDSATASTPSGSAEVEREPGISPTAFLLGLDRYLVARARLLGCTVLEIQAIDSLQVHGPQSQTELAQRLAARHSVVAGVVDRLVARGFVARDRFPGDRRRVRLVLSGPHVLDLDLEDRDVLEKFGDLSPQALKDIVSALSDVGEQLAAVADRLREMPVRASSPRRIR